MTAIPKEILTHSCILKTYSCEGVFGDRALLSETQLHNVRLSIYKNVSCDNGQRKTSQHGVLYFDCVNSIPCDTVFLHEDRRSIISFNGTELEVTGVRYIYGGGGLHHLEVQLG